jgi:hypothetical protein
MTNQREPAAKVARATLEWPWLYAGLVILMLCRLASLPSLLASSEMSVERRPHEVERRIDLLPWSAREFETLQRATPNEDATTDAWVVASRLGFERTAHRRIGLGPREIRTHDEHLLISTGLGRGPPISG